MEDFLVFFAERCYGFDHHLFSCGVVEFHFDFIDKGYIDVIKVEFINAKGFFAQSEIAMQCGEVFFYGADEVFIDGGIDLVWEQSGI